MDEEEKILGEMDEVRSAAAARAKKERKKRREAKTKARVRAAQLALSEPSPSKLLFGLRTRPVAAELVDYAWVPAQAVPALVKFSQRIL